ncbi:MAG TPA: DUF3576 domain-containing protein [Acetobacteraceae bacterium]|jgi:predicted small secreted protein|nr:DUF3576 domain-containing protein [Acetobacteraceae bacterium]
MSNLRPLIALLCASSLALAACSKARGVGDDEYQDYRTKGPEKGLMFGDSGLTLGVSKNASTADQGAALGVNAYLWRGALDTLGFMPLASADPFGGVIITDWYAPPAANGTERFKATAYILGRQLRADGVRVSIFRQVLRGNQWVDAPVSPVTTGEIENKVLARARELRSSQTASN